MCLYIDNPIHYYPVIFKKCRRSLDMAEESWFDDYAEESDEIEIHEYDITASPNDFNVLTIYNFIESGAVRIPGFQRNYVWDISSI